LSLSIIPIGVGDAFSQKYYSSSLVITANGHSILVDCPHPIRKMLYENTQKHGKYDIDNFLGILLSHLHADHCSGVEGFLFYSKYCLNRNTLIAAHKEVLDRLWQNCLSGAMDTQKSNTGKLKSSLDDYADIIELKVDSSINMGPFEIECRKTLHHIPTYAFRIRAENRIIGYSSDTAFDLGLIDWFKDCDLIIHETNLGIHTPYEKLAELPISIRKKMKLIHYPDDFDIKNSVIEPLIQGQVYLIQ